jgi:hypothetical protein
MISEISGSFWQALFRHEDAAFFFVLMGMFALIVTVAIVAHVWEQLARHQTDADLKRSMIERGMSADEIERVLKAKSGGR